MIQDNAIIHGRAVGAWKQLGAGAHDQPSAAHRKNWAHFIERYLTRPIMTGLLPPAAHGGTRKQELEAEEREFLANAAGAQGIQAQYI